MTAILVSGLMVLQSDAALAGVKCKKSFFPASGQTTPSSADIDDGIAGPVPCQMMGSSRPAHLYVSDGTVMEPSRI
jgi:hypothetical protein